MRNIVIITLVVLAASLPNLDTGVKMAKSMFQTEGVLQCIANKDVQRKINSAQDFCGAYFNDQVSCYSTYSSFKLCLINSNCQNRFDEQKIDLDCWNCWADMLTDVKEMKDYHELIRPCSSYSSHLVIYFLVVFMFLLLG